MRRLALAIVAPFTIASWMGTHEAHAQTGLIVQVPDGCGSKEAFVAELVALKHSAATIEQLTLAIEIQSTETEFTLKLSGAQGTRELRDPSCETLFRTAVVIAAASMAAPERELSPAGLESADSVPTPPPSGVTPLAPSAANAPSKEASAPSRPAESMSVHDVQIAERDGDEDAESAPGAEDIGPEFMLGLGAVFGSTPKLSFGVEAGAELGLKRWSLMLLARYVPTTTTNADADARLSTEVWGGRLSVGYEVTRTVRAELGVSAHRIRAAAVGIRHPESDSVWFVAPELEAAFELAQWAEWSVEVALQGRIALNTPRFEMEPDSSVVFALPRVGAAGLFRIKWAP